MKSELNTMCLGALLSVGFVSTLVAQDDIPLLRPEEKEVLRQQEEELAKAITPALHQASKSTVRIWEKRNLKAGGYLAYGTVVGDGSKVLTKWSEIHKLGSGSLLVQSADGEAMPARITKVYADQDLALLEFEGEPLTPAPWATEAPVLGCFMAATQPDGQLAGFGVMSVRERSLRDSDKAFLGVVGEMGFDGPGVLVSEVSEGSGAAKAGIVPGDIILAVGTRAISGVMELRNALLPVQPGDQITLKVKRDEAVSDMDVLLSSRPEFPNIQGARLRQMEQMGTDISNVRDSFANVIQTDMGLQPNQVGGPVVNLKGEVIGISLARADRTRSFVMSASAVRDLLKQEGQDPAAAVAQLREKMLAEQTAMRDRMMEPRVPPNQASPEQLERHLGQMRRLMRLMEREMEALER